MCLSTVYMASADGPKKIMQDVARIEAQGRGFWLIDLFGEKKFIEGRLTTVDLVSEHRVDLEAAGAE